MVEMVKVKFLKDHYGRQFKGKFYTIGLSIAKELERTGYCEIVEEKKTKKVNKK